MTTEAVNDSNSGTELKDDQTSQKKASPKFFVKPDKTLRIEVDILSDPDDGQIHLIVQKNEALKALNIDKLGNFVHTSHWFEFSVPNYAQMSEYRERCSVLGNADKFVVDNIRLRQFILLRHLREWSLTDDDGNIMPLAKNADGSLTLESENSIMSLPNSLIDVVMNAFEKDAMIF